MGVLHAVLTIVIFALLGGTGYALMVVLCLRLRNSVFRRIELSELPPEVMEALRALVQEVRDEGLTLAALQHEQRPTGDSDWGAVCCDSSRTTWAVAQSHRTLFTNERRINLALYSRLANGSVIVTTRHNPAAFVAPESWRMTRGAFDTVRRQWEAHRQSIASYGGSEKVEGFVNYEEFREWCQQQRGDELDALWNKKFLVIGAEGTYRFAPVKLHLALWQGLVEVALWIRAKAGPWTLSAKSRLIECYTLAQARASGGYRLAKSRATAWQESRRRAATSGSQGGMPAAKESQSEALEPSSPPEPVSQADIPGPRNESAPSAQVPIQPSPAAGEQPATDAAAVSGPYVPPEFGMLMSAQTGLAASPAVPKSRLEVYRERTSRMTLPGLLGWSVQGMLQCAALAAILFVVSSRGMLDQTSWALIAAVLVLHELGHVIMMRVTRGRHPAVFFLPVFGWLAGGRKICVSPRKAFWTQLMGPLPGLVAGWGILLWNHLEPGRPEWLLDGAFWAVLLNTFFLLPINPFDGGRIADLVFLNRHPYLRLVYYFCGAMALSALYFVSPVLLVIPVAVLAQVPGAFRTRRLSGAVRQAIHTVEPEEKALLKTFKVIEGTGNQKLYKRFAWTSTIDRLLRIAASQRLGFFGRACGAGIHVVLLFLPVIALVAYGVSLRVDQAEGLEEATARMTVLEEQVRWIGVPPDAGNRRILEQIQASGEAPAPAWKQVSQFIGDHAGVEGPAGAGVFDPGARPEVVALARQLNWTQVGSWIVEREEEARSRRALITGIVSALIESSKSEAGSEDVEAVGSDLSVAYWAIISCEPRHSFMEWSRWSQLESEVLVALEELGAAQQLSEEKRTWFLKALSQAPRPEGRKLALLLLRDLTDGMVMSGDVYAWRELMGWNERPGNRVWDPDPDKTRAELASDLRARREEFGGQSPAEGPMLSPRTRVAHAIQYYVTPLLSGEHLPACLEIADQWSGEDEATPLPQGDNQRVIESWNRRLRPILRVTSHRKVAAAALGGSRPAPPTRELAEHGQE